MAISPNENKALFLVAHLVLEFYYVDQVDVHHLKCVSMVGSSSRQEMNHRAVDVPAITLLTLLDKVPHSVTKWECY